MQRCEFTIRARGPAEPRRELVRWLRALPAAPCEDAETPLAVDLSGVLTDAERLRENPRQGGFWAPRDFVVEEADEVRLRGELRDAPPLLLLAEVARRFPALACECTSNVEGERYERWRGGSGGECEQIEELIVDARTDEVLRRWLKPGEAPYFRPTEDEAAAANAASARFEQFLAAHGLGGLGADRPLLVLDGELAEAALAALPSSRREFTLRCTYRLRGVVFPPFGGAPTDEEAAPHARRELSVVFGAAGEEYAYARHAGTGQLPGLAVCRRSDAAALVRHWCAWLKGAQASVNSSPHSPEYFSCEPWLDEDLFPAIAEALGIDRPPGRVPEAP